jgi:lysophospholipase L1-like esterase
VTIQRVKTFHDRHAWRVALRSSHAWRVATSTAGVVLGTLLVGGCSSSSPTTAPTTTGPRILCPAAPVPTPAGNATGSSVAYGAASVNGGAPTVSTSCLPTSGSTFPVGSTNVVCTATDALGRTDSCAFPVVVEPFVPPRVPTLAVTNFVAFGDSITWGDDGVPLVVCGANTNGFASLGYQLRPYDRVALPYPAGLKNDLEARYTTQTIVVDNAGKPGEATFGDGITSAARRFHDVIAGRSQLGPYNGVLLMEGSNDIYAGNDDAKIGSAVANLGLMVDDARNQGLRVFLATIPPMVPGGNRACGNHEVAPLNDGIRALAMQKGVTLVDVYNGLGPNYQQYIGQDGLHPNQAGYAKIASIFFDALTTTLETTSTLKSTSRYWRR